MVLAVAAATTSCKNGEPGSDAGSNPDLRGCVGAACTPNPDGCAAGTPTTIVGNVFAPNGVDPVPRVSVWVPSGALPAPKTGLSCDLCAAGSPPGAATATLTRTDGFFSLSGVAAGDSVTVVAELGRFRRVTHMKVVACKQNVVPGDSPAHGLRLPGKDLELGPDDRAPHIAVATGDFDQIECVLKRMGFSQFDLYNDRNAGTALPATVGEFAALLADAVKLATYQILVVNCTNAQFEDAMALPATRKNLEAYVAGGGRLYATDWAYDVINQVPEFAPYICFVSGGVNGPSPMASCPTTSGTPKAAHSTANYDSSAQITDDGLRDWLLQIPNTLVNMVVPIRYNFVVVNQLGDMLHPGKVYAKGLAEDPLALPMFSKGVRPLTMTFDYKGCGRVHYSTYNTEPSDVVPDTAMARYPSCGGRTNFNAQERILEYLIFEVAQCIGQVL